MAQKNLSDDAQQLLIDCYADMGVMGKTFFPNRFTRPFSKNHYKIFDAIQDPTKQKISIVGHRGLGKSSIAHLLTPGRAILFQDYKFIVPISASATQAEMQTEALKNELTANSRIKSFFGDLEGSSWAKESWITKSGTMVLPRGAGQKVRGLLFRDHRPDYIIVDDLEDDESIMTDDQRKKIWNWFMSDVVNAVDLGGKNWKIIVIGNMLHSMSLPARLLEEPEWEGFRLDILDENGESTWPEFMTTEDVAKKAEEYRSKGLISTFYREFRCLPIATEDRAFDQAYFKYYDEKDLMSPPEGKKPLALETVVIVDPAKTTGEKSAETGILCVSFADDGSIYIRDIRHGKLHFHEIISEAFDMVERLGARTLAYEVTSLHEFITAPLKDEIAKRGLRVELLELHARGHKEDRARALVPLYRSGRIYHNKTATAAVGSLEEQLLAYPRPKYWDVLDCAAYISELMDMGDKFQWSNLYETPEAIEAEYEALQEEFSHEFSEMDEEYLLI